MTENEELNNDAKALLYFGKAYLAIPRVIMERKFSTNENESIIGVLHFRLYHCCNYSDSYVSFNGHTEFCRKGEYITSYEDLAKQMGVSSRTIRRYVNVLKSECLVEVRRVADRICIRVCGYDVFTVSRSFSVKAEKKKETVRPVKQPDARVLAERRAEEEQKISKGHKPRIDLLNQLYK